MSTILSVTDLRKTFTGGVEAVRGVSLSIEAGAIFAFLGPNGAGKSTTIRMICGLCRPTGGSIAIDGRDSGRDHAAFMRSIGLVSQHFNVDDELTAYENMRIHAQLCGMGGRRSAARIRELLDFAGLGECRDRPAGKLSGGMRRRLQIVRALVHEPRILFLDEPTAGLDPMSRERIWNLIRELNASGMTVFFTTHYIDEAEHYAERVAIMHNGRIITDGSPVALIEGIGPWCREAFKDGMTTRTHFRGREEAETATGDGYTRLTIRRTQLEDVFIMMSGSSFEESDGAPARAVNGHDAHVGHGAQGGAHGNAHGGHA